MGFPRSGTLTTVSLGMCVVLGLAAGGCGKSSPTSPTPIDSIAATGFTGVGSMASAASVSASARGMAAAIVEWECFAAGPSASCLAPRVSAQAVSSGEVVTTPPGNLTRTVQGTTVLLGWSPPPGSQPTSYVVEAGSTSGASNIAVFDTGNAATGLTVNNVPPGTYFVRVRGRDAAGTGPASNEVTVVVTGAGPAPGNCQPRNLTGIAVGADVALGWDEPSGAGSQCGSNSYLVQVGSSPGASDLAQVSTPGLIAAFNVSGVGPGTFYIRVRSQGPGGVSAPSNELVITVTGITPPGTTTWTGLVANGEGSTGPDDDCGVVRADVTLTIVQSGTSITGISRLIVRSASSGECQPLVGFTIGEPFSGTVTGQFPNGSGTISITTPSGSAVTGSYANGRMTGTAVDSGGDPATFIVNRQ
jgi:hypothetical protein